MFLFTLALIIHFSYQLQLDVKNISLLAKVLFFDRFIDEYTITSVFLFLLINKYRLSTILGILFFTIYISLGTIQLITYTISKDLMSKLALENVEFIGFLFTFDNVKIVLFAIVTLILLPTILSYLLIKKSIIKKIMTHSLFTFFLILLLFISHYNAQFIGIKTIQQRDTLYNKNYFSHTAPLQAFANLFKKRKEEKLNFNTKELELLNTLDLPLNPLHKYPLLKKDIYTTSLPFERTEMKPNIILIFTEGYSARTSTIYSKKYPNLTPHLKEFSNNKKSMIVTQFYNHTAATYRGLHGQLCSLYPLLGGGDVWFENDFLNLATIQYKCLPHILQDNGYETTYLNMHYKDASANDEMVSHFGFNHIISGEELSDTYLGGVNHIKGAYLSDHQSYNTLIGYLKTHEKNKNKPFFLATYTIETHAFLDIGSDGIAYKDGKNNVLNTIHNMDNAFGNFWNYFKNSTYAQNTIIVFTSDHAHYFGKEYIHTMQEYNETDYHQIFIDKVPLLIYAPMINLPSTWNANQATSIDLAPTLLHLLNIKNQPNAFIGKSLFDTPRKDFGISAYGRNLYMIKKNNLIYLDNNVLPEDSKRFNAIKKYIQYVHELETMNRIYPKE